MTRPWIALVFVMACGPGGVKIDDLPDEIAEARCEQQVRCGGMPDAATCNANLVLHGSDVETTVAAVKAGQVKYDEDQARRCLDSIRNDGCTFRGLHLYDDPCRNLFVGTLATGAACFANEECADNARCTETDANCDRSSACCAGTCATAPVIRQAGEQCDQNNRCADGTFCKSTGVVGGGGICTPLAESDGAACSTVLGCIDPFYCNVDLNTGMGTCKRPAAPAAPCNTKDLLACIDARDYCDATTNTCTRRVAPGESCATARCVGFARCDAATKVCVAQPGVGQACTDAGPACLGTTECQLSSGTGTCTLPPDGAACM